VVRKTESRSSKGRLHYAVEYTFQLDGVAYTDRVPLGAGDYAAVQEGQAVGIRVLKWMPARGHWPHLRGYWPAWEGGATSVVTIALRVDLQRHGRMAA
jgi:hypothetical protein